MTLLLPCPRVESAAAQELRCSDADLRMGHHHHYHHHHHNNNNHKSRLAQQKQVQTSNQPISPTPVSSPAGARDAVSPLSISLQSFIAHPLPFSHQPLLVVSAKAPRAHTATLPSITHSSRSSAPCHSAAEYSVSVLPFPCPASPHPPFYPSIHPVSIANYKTCEHAALTRGFLWRSASIKAKVKVAICATALFSWRLGLPELNSRRRGRRGRRGGVDGGQGRRPWEAETSTPWLPRQVGYPSS